MAQLIHSFQGSKVDILLAVGLLIVLSVMFSITVGRILYVVLYKKMFDRVDDNDELRKIGNQFWRESEKV